MRPIYITKQLAAASADAVAASQTPLAGGPLTLTADPVVLDTQRQLLFTFAADETGRTFVVTGTDDQGHVISESVAGDAATAVTVLDYKTVTEITIDAASADAIEVGTNEVGATPPIPLDQYVPDFSVMIACIASGTIDYTVQYTFDDVFVKYSPGNTQAPGVPSGPDPASITWWPHSDITGATGNDKGALTEPVKAVRLLINSGNGSVEMQVIQGGTQ